MRINSITPINTNQNRKNVNFNAIMKFENINFNKKLWSEVAEEFQKITPEYDRHMVVVENNRFSLYEHGKRSAYKSFCHISGLDTSELLEATAKETAEHFKSFMKIELLYKGERFRYPDANPLSRHFKNYAKNHPNSWY